MKFKLQFKFAFKFQGKSPEIGVAQWQFKAIWQTNKFRNFGKSENFQKLYCTPQNLYPTNGSI